MPDWLLITILVLAVAPGAVMVLAVVVAMFFAPADFDLRRTRLAEGLCVHCGYDLRGGTDVDPATSLCPECGLAPFTSPEPVRKPPGDAHAAPH